MIINRRSGLTGKINTMDIPVTQERLACPRADSPDVLIQDFFLDLSADQREFLKTGITPEEWDDVFGKEE
jgi:hypothetical protein